MTLALFNFFLPRQCALASSMPAVLLDALVVVVESVIIANAISVSNTITIMDEISAKPFSLIAQNDNCEELILKFILTVYCTMYIHAIIKISPSRQ